MRSAALTPGVADAGPATMNSARASADGEAAQVGASATRQSPAAVATLRRVDGQPGDAEGVEVAAGGALGHLELGRHLGRRHLPALLEQEEDGDQTVRTHA